MDSKKNVKVNKLEGAASYVEWRRMMKATLRRNDYLLLGLEESAQDYSQEAINVWRKTQITAKSDITLHLGPQPHVRCWSIIDDDKKTADEL